MCYVPFTGTDCSIDGSKPPTNVKTEMTCNGYCQNAIITGEGFSFHMNSKCEYTEIEVSGA